MVTKKLKQLRKDGLMILREGLLSGDAGMMLRSKLMVGVKDFSLGNIRFSFPQFRNIYVIGAGKAAGPMALTLQQAFGNRIKDGVVLVGQGQKHKTWNMRFYECAHPIPESSGMLATKEMERMLSGTGPDDLVIGVFSGGGSSMLVHPVDELSLSEKQQTHRALLKCGASIEEINAVRCHLSQVKGGGLLDYIYPSRSVNFILSDVIGNSMQTVASGPTMDEKPSVLKALEVVQRYSLASQIPYRAVQYLRNLAPHGKPIEKKDPFEKEIRDQLRKQVLPKGNVFKVNNLLVGDNVTGLQAAGRKARQMGYKTKVLTAELSGDAKKAAKFLCGIAKVAQESGVPVKAPACLLSGGETTVKVTGDGKGGRNQELALAAALQLAGTENILLISCGTDGQDGETGAAGAIADSSTIDRAKNLDLSAKSFLENNDSYNFFHPLNDLITTGATNTNVMDFQIVLIR